MNAKAFFVILFFIFLVATLANGAVSSTDLTPDTTPIPGSIVQPGMMAVEGVSTNLCASPYRIQQGDTLFGIARRCGLVIADLLAANPHITNPNFIRAGHDLILPAPRVNATVTAPPPAPTDTPAPTQPVPDVPTNTPPPAPAASSSLIVAPNSTYHVDIADLPPNSGVFLMYGPTTNPAVGKMELTTNEGGHLIADITIPATAPQGETWTVLVMVKDTPDIEVTTTPFQIGYP